MTTSHQPPFFLCRLSASILACLPAWAAAQATTPPADGGTGAQSIVVVGTRLAERPFDVPASIDRIGGDQIRDDHLQVNISESLGGVPGLLARDRQNYAQDVQLSVRGFGARSTFGIRGVRLYVDGVPATLPDGQGQISHADLGSASRIDVLRGPFSALYGNSSGGVLEVTTAEGFGAPTVGLGLAGGSDGVLRANLQTQGGAGEFGYTANLSHFETDGYREHSAARRDQGNLKLTWRPAEGALQGDKLTVVANSMSLPEAQDPLGLTRAEYDADPRGVDPVALDFDTRKSVNQTQLGATYEHRLAADQRLQLMAYGGTRNTEQYQAIPTGPQGSPKHPGGVIDLSRDYQGTDLRWTLDRRSGALPFAVVAGVAYDDLDEHRRGYLNYIGDTLGVKGDLRRDENNSSTAFDQYVQATLRPAADWRVDAGLRHSQVKVRSRDHYIVPPNLDDSGHTDFSATTPVASVMYLASDELHFYASAGRGFETPTLNELAYRPDGSAGLNLALKPARSNNYELGAKARLGPGQTLNAAVFAVRTRDEIVTQTNQGGRASFQNAGKTRRDGVELGWTGQFAGDWSARAALTWLNARYDESFYTCAGTPCSQPTLLVPAGNRLPGVARTTAFAALQWAPADGWRAGVEMRSLDKVAVNDSNTDYAAAFTIASASVGYRVHRGAWDFNGFVRADNLFDKQYAGSVIVNEGNGRFFEPAPGRTWLAGVNASWSF
ncbi:MAG: TonB-dependent receptor [Burkholderiaceae bacterium]